MYASAMHDCLGHPATIQHNTQYNIMETVLIWDMPATLVHACSLKSTMATYYPHSCLQQLHIYIAFFLGPQFQIHFKWS